MPGHLTRRQWMPGSVAVLAGAQAAGARTAAAEGTAAGPPAGAAPKIRLARTIHELLCCDARYLPAAGVLAPSSGEACQAAVVGRRCGCPPRRRSRASRDEDS
jgi:hypothetical protein